VPLAEARIVPPPDPLPLALRERRLGAEVLRHQVDQVQGRQHGPGGDLAQLGESFVLVAEAGQVHRPQRRGRVRWQNSPGQQLLGLGRPDPQAGQGRDARDR